MTNSLAIRRLDLPLGDSAKILAAWMTFPEFHIAPVRQGYTRLADRRYRYEAFFNRFTAEFEVDGAGLVLAYPGYWEGVPESAGKKGRRRARA